MPELTAKQLKQVASRIEMCTQDESRKSWANKCRRMRDLYAGKLWPDQSQSVDGWPLEAEHEVTVNLAQVNTDIAVASIAYSDPEFQIIPQEPEAEQNAQWQKAALSKVWNEINALHIERLRLKTAVVEGVGVNFVGWRFEEENKTPHEGARPDYLPQEGPLPTLLAEDGSLVAPPPEPEPEESLEVTYDNPSIRSVKPTMFYVDPDHDDMDDLRDAKYVFEVWRLPEEDVKKNKAYSNTKDIKGDSRIGTQHNEDEERKQRKTDEKYVTLYSYWQRRGRRHLVFAEGQFEKPLLDEEWPYRYHTYPYTTLVYRNLLNEQLPQGSIEPAETSILSYNLYRSIQLRHDEQMARCLMGYDGSKLTEDGKKALKEGRTGALVECAGPPNETIQPLQHSALPQDFYATQAGSKEDANVAMASNDYLKGTPDRTRRTLGEVERTVSLSAARAQLLQRDYERACEKDANLILTLLQDERFCDRKRWMVITGQPQEQMPPGDWNADTIRGQSDVKVVCNSTRIQTPESLQGTMSFALQSLMPYVQAGLINPGPFLKKFGQSISLTPQEMDEVLKAQDDQVNVEQQVQETQAAVTQLAQVVKQLMDQVQQLGEAIGQGQTDAKTTAEMERKKLDMDMAAQKHQLDMEMSAEKHMADMERREVSGTPRG